MGGAVRGPSSELHPGICLTTEENHGKPQSGWVREGRVRAGDYIFSMEKETEFIHWEEDFFWYTTE
jgi:hypothetical protein